MYLAIFLCLLEGFRPRFHSVWSRPLCNFLVKKINQGTDVLTHNCLPPLLVLCVLKHVCTRLIILTSNHKIKIDVASWQSAVEIHPFDCKYLFCRFRKCWSHWLPVWGEGVCENVSPVVKWDSHYYWYYIHYVNQYVCGFSSFFLFYTLKFQFIIFNLSTFRIFFQPSYSPLGGPETWSISVSPLACRQNAR